MTFANPAMLWGAGLAALPLLVHLFNRKRARPRPFAAIDFVLRSRRRTARKLRLKRVLLFLVRTLLLAAIPVALARPQTAHPEPMARPAGPMATALVFDTSLSMSYELGGKSLLERAKQMSLDGTVVRFENSAGRKSKLRIASERIDELLPHRWKPPAEAQPSA